MSAKRKPLAASGGAGARKAFCKHRHSTTRRLPNDWRDRLPQPADYYTRHVDKLTKPNQAGWAQGRCPLHDDAHASLSVHLGDRGGWNCFAGCGAGDLLGFHQRLTGLQFLKAVHDLLGARP